MKRLFLLLMIFMSIFGTDDGDLKTKTDIFLHKHGKKLTAAAVGVGIASGLGISYVIWRIKKHRHESYIVNIYNENNVTLPVDEERDKILFLGNIAYKQGLTGLTNILNNNDSINDFKNLCSKHPHLAYSLAVLANCQVVDIQKLRDTIIVRMVPSDSTGSVDRGS